MLDVLYTLYKVQTVCATFHYGIFTDLFEQFSHPFHKIVLGIYRVFILGSQR